jgi:acyl carrier protein
MATMLKTVTTAAAFPAADVEACIRDALQDQADTQAILRPPLPGAPSAGPEIDSLAVVEIICSIEELLGVTLPASFVPRGGYERAEACVQDLLKAAQDVWDEATNEEVEHA